MSKELTVTSGSESRVQLFDQKPAAMVANATEIANVLSNVIENQHLAVDIQGNKYVKAEGWNCLGSLLGILPREREVRQLDDGSFEAYVELISHKTGSVVGCGSAICSVTEPRWSKAPLYARRSMAITRATGKAYRLGLSWIVTLKGYSPTPFEEMADLEPPVAPSPANNSEPIYQDTAECKRWLMSVCQNAGVTETEHMKDIHALMVGRPESAVNELITDALKEQNG